MANPNRVDEHVHHYVLKGSGLSCWAECAAPPTATRDDGTVGPICGNCGMGLYGDETICEWCTKGPGCGEKLAGDNGPIVGSRSKVEAAIADA